MPLATLRIAVAGLWFLYAWRVDPRWAAQPPVAFPVGAAWLAPWLSETLLSGARLILLATSLCGGLGFYARPAFLTVTVAGFAVMGASQFHGGTQHAHHLLWFAALLAVSPCTDALSARRWRPRLGTSLAWGVPTRVAWVLLACIYFFPGLHKWLAQGIAWAGDPLYNTLLWKWAQAWDFTPLTRIDTWPTWLWAGGLGVLLFEIGCPLLLWNRWTRLAFALCALGFHSATQLWFAIDFTHLIPCLVVLLPYEHTEGTPTARSWLPAGVVGMGLVAGAASFGTLGITQGWPFACYPTFHRSVGTWMPTIQVIGHDDHGQRYPVPERALADAESSQAFYSEVWGITGLYGVHQPVALDAFARRILARPAVQSALGPATSIRLHRAHRDLKTGLLRIGPEIHRRRTSNQGHHGAP